MYYNRTRFHFSFMTAQAHQRILSFNWILYRIYSLDKKFHIDYKKCFVVPNTCLSQATFHGTEHFNGSVAENLKATFERLWISAEIFVVVSTLECTVRCTLYIEFVGYLHFVQLNGFPTMTNCSIFNESVSNGTNRRFISFVVTKFTFSILLSLSVKRNYF